MKKRTKYKKHGFYIQHPTKVEESRVKVNWDRMNCNFCIILGVYYENKTTTKILGCYLDMPEEINKEIMINTMERLYYHINNSEFVMDLYLANKKTKTIRTLFRVESSELKENFNNVFMEKLEEGRLELQDAKDTIEKMRLKEIYDNNKENRELELEARKNRVNTYNWKVLKTI